MSTQRADIHHRGLVGQSKWEPETAPPGGECPDGNESCTDRRVRIDDGRVGCRTCGAVSDPRAGKAHAYRNSHRRSEDARNA